MTLGKKIRVAVLYGGRSGEHEVSLRSGASVIDQLDKNKYEIIPIGIDKNGKWLMNSMQLIDSKESSLVIDQKDNKNVILEPNPGEANLVPLNQQGLPTTGNGFDIDIFFPVLHGTYCEDGTLQGLLELSDKPYVGCGVLASAVGMDKEVAKKLVQLAGVPVVPYISVDSRSWTNQRHTIIEKIERDFGYPVFVKPVNSGSSVGIHKIKSRSEVDDKVKDAFQYDTRVLIEKAIDAREIELAVLESPDDPLQPRVSVAGEIIPNHDFYSYEAKYLDENGAAAEIPAKLSPEVHQTCHEYAAKIFTSLQCEGLARVDLFIDRKTGDIYFNEINTLPGFTSISMYPKLWIESGLSYPQLLDELIKLGISRHKRKQKLLREFRTPAKDSR